MRSKGAVVTLDRWHRRGPHRQQRRADSRPARGLPRLAIIEQSDNAADRRTGFRGASRELLASFPFPHLVEVDVDAGRPRSDRSHHRDADHRKAVPLCFGFHPYLQMPDVPRERVAGRRHRRCATWPVDARGFPRATTEEWPATTERVGRPRVRRRLRPGSPTARCSRCPAAAGASRCASSGATPRHRSSRPRPTTSSVSSRWPRRPMRCAAADYRCARPGRAASAQFSIRVS